MANRPTDDDREDDAHDRKPEMGSNSVPPKRITNRELRTPSIDHNGHIDAVLRQLYTWRGSKNAAHKGYFWV
jgi:hypothetical protein